MFSTGCNFYSATRWITTLVRTQFFSVLSIRLGQEGGADKKNNSTDGLTRRERWTGLHSADTFPQLETFALLWIKVSEAACLASLELFVLISVFYLPDFLCGSTGKSCHGTFNKKRKQAQNFPFTHRITARFQRSENISSKFYDGIVISTIVSNRYCVSVQKMQF